MQDKVSLVLLAHADVDEDRLWLLMLQHAAQVLCISSAVQLSACAVREAVLWLQVNWEVEPLSFAHAASFSGRVRLDCAGGSVVVQALSICCCCSCLQLGEAAGHSCSRSARLERSRHLTCAR